VGARPPRRVALALAAARLRAFRGDRRALDIALYILVPTRMLTRMGTAGALLLAVIRAPFAMPLPLAALTVFAEWGVPAYIGWRERLVAFNRAGVSLALRHSVLSLMWFPIGAWALLTARVRAWDAVPRRQTESSGVP